jgi:hypothetical protein
MKTRRLGRMFQPGVVLGILAVAAVQPAATLRGRPSAPAPIVNALVPDTMKVSVQGAVPVNARIGDVVTVKLAERSPWWESKMLTAFGAALIGGLLVIVSQAAGARLARGKLHRNTLVRLDRLCQDYLNEILSNKRLALDAKKAAEDKALFWHLPHPFKVDPSFAVDIFDRDMVRRVASVNTDLSRYNRDLERLGRARDSLQTAHLAGTLPLPVWEDAMTKEAPRWGAFATHLDALDKSVRDVYVRAVLLVKQYDGFPARLLRFLGLGAVRSWSLNDGAVASMRATFDADRERELEASRKEIAERHRPTPDRGPS